MTGKICTATKERVDNDPGACVFLCPQCGEQEIVRSTFARARAIKYVCGSCNFEGPN